MIVQPVQDKNSYNAVHAKRYALSMGWLRLHLAGANVLELGGGSTFTEQMKSEGASSVRYTDFDLRYPWPDNLADTKFDLIVCMEVIEHINDQDIAGVTPTEWQGTGAACMLAEARKHLRQGGLFFVTTPNASSYTAINHALRLSPPMIYRPHVREYAPYELDELVRKSGFEITRRETYDAWLNAISDYQRNALRRYAALNGYPTELRGEDIFLLAKA